MPAFTSDQRHGTPGGDGGPTGRLGAALCLLHQGAARVPAGKPSGAPAWRQRAPGPLGPLSRLPTMCVRLLALTALRPAATTGWMPTQLWRPSCPRGLGPLPASRSPRWAQRSRCGPIGLENAWCGGGAPIERILATGLQQTGKLAHRAGRQAGVR